MKSVEFRKERRVMCRRGFTLIELLGAICILVILAAFLIGSTKKIADGASRAKCAGNLRHIGMAATQYAADNNGNYPMTYDLVLGKYYGIGLIDLLMPYTDADYRAFYCPDALHCHDKQYDPFRGLTYAWQQAKSGSEQFNSMGYFWLVSSGGTWDAMQFGGPPPKMAGSVKRVLATCPHFGGGRTHGRLYNLLYADGRVAPLKADNNGDMIGHISQQTLEVKPDYNP